jgi:hypothetical protein
MDTVGPRVPTTQNRDSSAFDVKTYVALQRGASWLQTASADLWTFKTNTIAVEDIIPFA